MDVTVQGFLTAVRVTLQSPREAARALIAADLPMPVLGLGLALAAVASSLITHLGLLLAPLPDGAMQMIAPSPLRTAVLQGIVLLGLAAAVHQLGRLRGGRGIFSGALAVVVWVQAMLVVLQAVQLVAMVILPPLAEILSVLGLGLFLSLLTHFVAELHGFRSLGATFAGIVAAILVVAFVMSVVLTVLIGLPDQGV
ncbi:MAG: YIP1 family protein [Rhodobacterales bacterium]|nr:YIP1 family protein [Rhodobacterales bacterium]